MFSTFSGLSVVFLLTTPQVDAVHANGLVEYDTRKSLYPILLWHANKCKLRQSLRHNDVHGHPQRHAGPPSRPENPRDHPFNLRGRGGREWASGWGIITASGLITVPLLLVFSVWLVYTKFLWSVPIFVDTVRDFQMVAHSRC